MEPRALYPYEIETQESGRFQIFRCLASSPDHAVQVLTELMDHFGGMEGLKVLRVTRYRTFLERLSNFNPETVSP